MKKKLLLLFTILAIGLTNVWAQNFTDVAPSGQRLVYNIISSTNHTCEVATNPSIAGTLVIPSTANYTNGTTYSVISIRNDAFFYCSGLTSVTIPNSVTSIGETAFQGCSGLTSVTIPNSVTSIGEAAFWGCSGLTSVTISNSVTSIENGTFRNCSGLTSVTLPNSVTTIRAHAFDGCSGLTSVTLPNSVTSIGTGAFNACLGLTSVNYLGSLAEWCNISFSDAGANPACYANGFSINGTPVVGSIDIPSGVSEIKIYAFAYCSGLTSVTIPNSVTSIGRHAFFACTGLTSVTMTGYDPPSLGLGGSSVFGQNASNRMIYVPCGAYDNYYNASDWSDYRSSLSEPIVDVDVSVNADSERGSASIIPLRGHDVRCDSTVVVKATANDGYHFDHWSTGSTQAQDTIVIDGDTTITAYFAANQTQDIEDVKPVAVVKVIGDCIAIENAKGENVIIFDVMGCMIVNEPMPEGKLFRMSRTGVYMVKVGNQIAQKVVVVR